jgi:1-phosphofructokinase
VPNAGQPSGDGVKGAEATDGEVCVFSPVPLLTVTIEQQAGDEPFVHIHAGGQGVWVARMVRRLGAHATLCAPFGGESGYVLGPLLVREGVSMREVEMESWNGVYIHDRRQGSRRTIAEQRAGALDRHTLDELYSVTIGMALEAGVCVLAGSPDSDVIPDDTYRRLATDLRGNGVQVIADLRGEQQRCALEGGLRLLKVSHEELLEDDQTDGDHPEAIIAAVKRLHERGARDVVVSRADQPAIALSDGKLYEVETPKVEVIDPRGAGDSMTAALAVALSRGMNGVDALRLAAAAGALNVTRHGLATGDAQSIMQLSQRIEVRPIESSPIESSPIESSRS